MNEHNHAILFVNWLRANNYLFHHSPNETFTKHHSVRRKNTLEGVSKGFPDYCVKLKRGNLLFIELKKERGKKGGMNGSKISPEQERWIDELEACEGVGAYFAHGWEEAVRIVEEMERF